MLVSEGQLYSCGTSYKEKDWEKENEVGQKDVERPVGKLVNLMAKIWLGHVIAPHERHGRFRNHDG